LVIEPFLLQAQQSGTLLASHCDWAFNSSSFRQLLKGHFSPVTQHSLCCRNTCDSALYNWHWYWYW